MAEPSHPAFSRGQPRYLLTKPVYIGRIRHKDKSHPGLHPPLVDADLWYQVQQHIAATRRKAFGGQDRPQPSRRLLLGKLFDQTGDWLVPGQSLRDGRRYWPKPSDGSPRNSLSTGLLVQSLHKYPAGVASGSRHWFE